MSDEEVVAAAVADVMPGGAMQQPARLLITRTSLALLSPSLSLSLPVSLLLLHTLRGAAEITRQYHTGAMSNYLRHAFSEPSRNLPGTFAGAMSDYLRHACVAAVFGQTLFAHGAVDARTAGCETGDTLPLLGAFQEPSRSLPGTF